MQTNLGNNKEHFYVSTNNAEQSNEGTDLESGNIKIFTIGEKKKKGKIYPIVRF